MRIPRRWVVSSIALVASLVGCSKREPPKPVQPADASTPARQEVRRTACAMVTAAEMSTIIGTIVGAEGDEGGGSTTCSYRTSGRTLPFVEIKVERGGGSAAMVAARMMGQVEPGMANRFAGLGDEASAIGPAFMVRTGEDLVNLTIMGIDDNVAVAKRILDVMRPRMGPSAQARTADSRSGGGTTATDSSTPDLAKAGQLVSGLLSGLAAENDRSKTSGAAGANATSASPTKSAYDDAAYGPATGPPIRIPLVAGLTLVGSEHEVGRGDYDPIVTITGVTDDMVSTVCSSNLPEGGRLSVDRAVRRDDLRQARQYLSWYEPDDPLVFAGTTSFSVSMAVFNDLKDKGQARIVRRETGSSPFGAIAKVLANSSNAPEHPGLLTRVEPHAVAFPVLLNDEPVQLRALHARGTFDDATVDYHILDDPDNPVILRMAEKNVGRIVRISFPTRAAAPIEEKLKKESRVALHGIYFDFGKATIRPESESVLREIATALTHNPDWKITVEGHTDNIGGDAMNLDLSRRRAEAVKQALVDRYRIAAAGLTTAGFGASRPADSNDTLAGRARNRRVELVRN